MNRRFIILAMVVVALSIAAPAMASDAAEGAADGTAKAAQFGAERAAFLKTFSRFSASECVVTINDNFASFIAKLLPQTLATRLIVWYNEVSKATFRKNLRRFKNEEPVC